ncbi:HutD family protein [Aeromicrobium sp. P5_D10]
MTSADGPAANTRGGSEAPWRPYADLHPSPWASGDGSTREAISYRESADLADGLPPWRLSIADLVRPGAFSRISGATRTFVPIDTSVVLQVDGVSHQISANTAFTFSGAAETNLTQLPHAAQAVNLMVDVTSPHHRDRPTPELHVCRSPALAAPRAIIALCLTASHGTDRFDLWLPSPELDRIGVRQWLVVH